MNQYKERIDSLRRKMQEAGIDVYYIPMSDCHNSEYVAPHFRCVEFISGFTGSAANVIVTAQDAWLFTDGRYYIQAAAQLEGSGIILMKAGQPDVPELEDFLKEQAAGRVLGFDGSVVPAEFGRQFEGAASAAAQAAPTAAAQAAAPNTVPGSAETAPAAIRCDRDLVGEIWTDRPAQIFTDIYELPLSSVGEPATAKIARIRAELQKHAGQDYLYIINSLDDIAWMFNLRANDIQDNPVQYAYAAISDRQVTLFTGADTDLSKCNGFAEGIFHKGAYATDCLCAEDCSHVLMDTARISYDTYRFYRDRGVRITELSNPSTAMKAVKNETEIRCLKEALVRDAVVVTNFMYWLKQNVGSIPMDEVSVADHLQQMRMEQEGYIELSFGTISAYRENAAQMHYAPRRGSCKELQPEGFLLVDSGCQYTDGTTDITRTFALGPLTEEERKAFTLTAASMLRLLDTVFIKGCTGENVDIMAREPMWRVGWDYKCGTGHGVGHILNVHEGPHRIKWQLMKKATAPLEPGMVVTNEPGVYREGKYGIRTENEMIVVPCAQTEDGTFYQFENLTWIPIDLDAIDTAYLTEEDLRLLNEYHRQTYDILAPHLTEEVRAWLQEYTRALDR